jgi:ABC-type polysaccharide/polyol phosphate export permease
MSSMIAKDQPAGFSLSQYVTCLNGIVWREGLRFIHQRERFISALVRPLVWLFIFAGGFRQVLGISITPPPIGYLTVLPALALSGLMLGALGMLISSGIRQLENFAGVMNFVIFPMFFASSALYPLWRVQEGSPMLYYVCQLNPFTHVVELVRFALYGKMNWVSLAVVGGCTAAFMIGAMFAYDPSRGLIRRGAAGGET